MTDHPDLETLSESLDGADAGPHVGRCPTCQGRLAELRWARDAMAEPVTPLADAVRERAIAQALAAAGEWEMGASVDPPVATTAPPGDLVGAGPSAPVGRGPAWSVGAGGADRVGAPAGTRPVVTGPTPAPAAAAPTRARWWLGGSAAAAVLALVMATVALLGRGTTAGHDTALSSGAPESGKQALSSPSSPGATAADNAVSGGDLGDIASVEALRARVAEATLNGARKGISVVGPAGSSAAAPQAAVPAPVVVGTRVCEEQARVLRPQVGLVVYAANLRFQGTNAVVLGFAPTPDAPPATLLVLATQEGCRLLAEVSPS